MELLKPKFVLICNRDKLNLSDCQIISKLFPEKILQEEVCTMQSSIISAGFIPIQKLSRLLGIPMPTLRRWERVNSMPQSIRFGGRIRYWEVATLKKWIGTLKRIPADLQNELFQKLEVATQESQDINPKEKK